MHITKKIFKLRDTNTSLRYILSFSNINKYKRNILINYLNVRR